MHILFFNSFPILNFLQIKEKETLTSKLNPINFKPYLFDNDLIILIQHP